MNRLFRRQSILKIGTMVLITYKCVLPECPYCQRSELQLCTLVPGMKKNLTETEETEQSNILDSVLLNFDEGPFKCFNFCVSSYTFEAAQTLKMAHFSAVWLQTITCCISICGWPGLFTTKLAWDCLRKNGDISVYTNSSLHRLWKCSDSQHLCERDFILKRLICGIVFLWTLKALL